MLGDITDVWQVCYSKSNMKSAFRNLGMLPSQYCLMVMVAVSPLDGKKYHFCDKCLPFGASISCSHFQRFSNSIAHATGVISGTKLPINYLDDYLFASYLKSLCNEQVNIIINICARIRFPVSQEKTFWSMETWTFLGFLINTIGQFVSIPVDKIERALTAIDSVLGHKHKKVTVHEMQQLCGFLNFLCQCVTPGRAFTRRLYAHFNSTMPHHYHIKVTNEMRDDLLMWSKFL